jgi:hypothetical protein
MVIRNAGRKANSDRQLIASAYVQSIVGAASTADASRADGPNLLTPRLFGKR